MEETAGVAAVATRPGRLAGRSATARASRLVYDTVRIAENRWRAMAADGGVHGVVGWLADAFAP